jgi:hypothetical protein
LVKTSVSDPLDYDTNDDTSSLSDLDKYCFIEDVNDNDQPVAPRPMKPIPAPAKTIAVKAGFSNSKRNEHNHPAAVKPASKQPTTLSLNKPAPLSVENASKEGIQQDHMQCMEAIASAMFTTPLGAPPTKKLRMNTTLATSVIPPSHPPSAPATSSLAPAVAIAIPLCSPLVPTASQSTALVPNVVPFQAPSVMEVAKAGSLLYTYPPPQSPPHPKNLPWSKLSLQSIQHC